MPEAETTHLSSPDVEGNLGSGHPIGNGRDRPEKGGYLDQESGPQASSPSGSGSASSSASSPSRSSAVSTGSSRPAALRSSMPGRSRRLFNPKWLRNSWVVARSEERRVGKGGGVGCRRRS